MAAVPAVESLPPWTAIENMCVGATNAATVSDSVPASLLSADKLFIAPPHKSSDAEIVVHAFASGPPRVLAMASTSKSRLASRLA